MVKNMFKDVFQKRKNNEHIWLTLFSLIIFCESIVRNGYSVIGIMFYKLQYDMSAESFGNLITVWMFSMFIGQMFIVPFFSRTLQMRDTSILMIGIIFPAFSLIGEGIFSQVWVMFLLTAVFYPLMYNIATTSKSAISKFLAPTEVGKIFGMLGIMEALLATLSKMSFGMMYQATVSFVSLCVVFIALSGFDICNHCSCQNEESRQKQLQG